MTDVNTKAARYLTPPEGAFWRWSDEGDVIEWADGPTIAFRSEVAAVLATLAPYGLPSLDLVVLLLAACQDSWGPDRQRLLTHVHTLRARVSAVQWIRDTIDALDAVHELSAPLRQTTYAKAELAAFVLETHPLRSTDQHAEDVCKLLNAGFSPEWPFNPDQPIKTVGEWIRELRGLFDGLQRVNEEDVRNRLLTGLDVLPEPVPDADDEPPVPPIEGGVRELLDALEREDEFHGLVRLTRNLMAVTHLPRPVYESDDLSLGGVSDISNRGPLDRLLLSELAHDDDTLMVRVALNEALYLRRERPPATPPREIAVLLDVGLRMWGVPRVYATAVALSLAATADGTTDVLVFRAAGSDVEAVDLTTREGLIAHLAALDPHVHPGDSLREFASQLGDVDCDVVLVTGEDVLADRDFRRQLVECELSGLYVAALGRDGSYRMLVRTGRGERTVREAVFSMDQLFAERTQPATPLIDPTIDPKLPAILRQRRFPLRLSHPVAPRNTMLVDTGFGEQVALAVTHDHRLMLWDARGFGARQIAERLPERHVLWWRVEDGGDLVRCVIGRPDLTNLHVMTVSLAPVRSVIHPLATDRRGGHTVCGHAGALFVIRRGLIEVFDAASGRNLPTPELPRHVRWRCGRFFAGWGGWYALSFDGLKPHMELAISRNNHIAPGEIAGVFDVDRIGSPLALLRNGCLLNPTAKEVLKVDHGLRTPVMLTGVSRNGAVFALKSINHQSDSGVQECLVTLKPQPSVRRVSNAAAYLCGPLDTVIRTRSLRTRWRSVVANREGLWLVARKGGRRQLTLDAATDRLQLTAGTWLQELYHKPRPQICLQSRKAGSYELWSTEWADGSRAILDSRGLLHLQSSDPSIPEVTLVLYDDNVAGWCADGRMWGSVYFVGSDQHPCSPAAIHNDVITPFLRRLR